MGFSFWVLPQFFRELKKVVRYLSTKTDKEYFFTNDVNILSLYFRVLPLKFKSLPHKDFISLAEYYCKIKSANLTTNMRLSVAITEYVNTLCYQFNRNLSYVSSLFKAETGKMLNQYIAETRLHHAKLLLLTDKNIDKIATECGFSDVAILRRTFKRYTGITPSEYRKNYKA